MKKKGKLDRCRTFLTHTLWEMEPDSFGVMKGRAVKYLQVTAMVLRGVRDDQCFLRASALTYFTILSMVPFFALAFAILKGFGVQNTIEPLILEQVAAGSEEIVEKVITYINNTKVASLGAIGLVALLFTVISLMGNIEEAFNAIWGVRETRSFYRKFSDYLSVLISGPILMIAAVSVTTTLQSQAVVQWIVQNTYLGDLIISVFHLVPYLSVWVAFVFLYIFIPNTRVRFRSALVGGIIAGTVWQGAQWSYIHFQVGVAKYNAIYGTLAVLPVFMVWIYVSWIIVLSGLEIVYAHQHIRTFRREVRIPAVSFAARERLALAALLEISRSFCLDRPAWNSEALAESLGVPERVMQEILDRLVAAGWLAPSAGEAPSYLPAREAEHMLVKGVLDSLKNQGEPLEWDTRSPEVERIEKLLRKVDTEVDTSLAGLSFRDLVAGEADDARKG